MADLLKQVWLVLVLGLLFGIVLAFTANGTAERIAENRQQQIRELAQKATLGEIDYDTNGKPEFKVKLQELSALRKKGLWAYKVIPLEGTKIIGYAVIAEGIGWDHLRMLVGLSPDLGRITGLEVVESRETPGLGNRIRENWFRKQYEKSTAHSLVLVKKTPTTKYQVQAITGATISSTAVTKMVNANVKMAKKLIKVKR